MTPTCCDVLTPASVGLNVLQATVKNYWKDNIKQYVVPVKSNNWSNVAAYEIQVCNE